MFEMKENKETAKRTQFLLFWGQWFVLMLLPCFGTSACDKVNSDSLLSLALKAPLNLNWSASTDCCLWEGITCGPGDQGHVVQLWLPRRGLTGVIHPSITSLTHLTHLNLSHNSLLGSLPDDLFSSLSSLQVIDLSFNHLIDRLPPSSNKISQLQVLNLSSNFFNGTIPSSILVPSVSIFNVSNNSFSGLMYPSTMVAITHPSPSWTCPTINSLTQFPLESDYVPSSKFSVQASIASLVLSLMKFSTLLISDSSLCLSIVLQDQSTTVS
ncbi:unnamed protein product [Prunus brigantina]